MAGGYGHGGGQGQALERLKGLPWGRGAVVGILSLLIPYVTIMAASLVLLQQRAAAIGTNIFFTIAGFGPGAYARELFVDGSSISSLGNVRPGDYPDFETEIERVLDILGTSVFGVNDPTTTPEALLLWLYVLVPLLLYLGGRYVARNHVADGDLVGHATAPLTFVVGTIPVVVLLVAAFPVLQPGGRILLVALVLPLVVGFAGTMTVYAFGDVSWFASKAYGWTAGVVGLLVTALLYPIPSEVSDVGVLEQFVLGVHGFLGTVSFGTGLSAAGTGGGQGADLEGLGFGFGGDPVAVLSVLFVFVLLVAAGAVRVVRSSRSISSGTEAARLGGSVFLGYLPMVALFGVALPLLAVIAGPSGVLGGIVRATLPDVAGFVSLVLVGGTVLPLVLGGLGGAVAYQVAQGQSRPRGSPGRGTPPSGGAPRPSQGQSNTRETQTHPDARPPQAGGASQGANSGGQSPPARSPEESSGQAGSAPRDRTD